MGAVGYTFKRGSPKDHPCQIWLSGFREEDLNRYKLAEWNISQKNPKYMLKYSLLYSCCKYLSSFWYINKQQWTIEEFSIFGNSSHLEWSAGLSDSILKGTYPWTIPARFGLICFSGFTWDFMWKFTKYDGHQVMAQRYEKKLIISWQDFNTDKALQCNS